MRDTDRDLRSVIVVRADSKIDSLEDLGAGESLSARWTRLKRTLLPLMVLRAAGIDPVAVRHDVGVGNVSICASSLLSGLSADGTVRARREQLG
jgi:phosphonate transport system substrate-binding protein